MRRVSSDDSGPGRPGARAAGRALVRTGLSPLLLLALGSAPADSAGLELSAWLGPSLPFYSQSFSYQPPPLPPLPGFGVEQQGEFRFDASGGLCFGGGLAWHGAGPLGVELRIDSGAIDVKQAGSRFTASLRPPGPLPPLSLDLELQGSVALERLLPVSLNLRYRSGGRVGLVASAGVTWLPAFDFAVSQQIGLGAIGGVGGIEVPALPLEAGGRIEGFWGANAGLGVRFAAGSSVSVQLEGRGFFFGEREIDWQVERFPVSPELGERLRDALGPIRFTPGFFQATAGISLRF